MLESEQIRNNKESQNKVPEPEQYININVLILIRYCFSSATSHTEGFVRQMLHI